MKRVLFIADFLKEDLPGGAERNDDNLITHLSENFEVVVERCKDITVPKLRKYRKDNYVIILGNFINMDQKAMFELVYSYPKYRYVIYEHDHKYLSTRDPSIFPDFKAPEECVINSDVYENAVATVCLSKIHREVLLKNLVDVDPENVFSIGTSLWSKSSFDFLRECSKLTKSNTGLIYNSQNPIKGTAAATQWVKKNADRLPFDSVVLTTPNVSWHELIKQISYSSHFVFMPQVLETFSRISAEAKMVGAKLLSKKKLLGAASEEDFSLNGEALIDALEIKVADAYHLFDRLVRTAHIEEETSPQKKEDMTCILNVYRRPHLLQEQIDALNSQTMLPKEILVWINDHEDNRDFDIEKLESEIPVKWFRSNANWKYHGRFAAALLVDSEFLSVYDDDTIPGPKWHEHALQSIIKQGGKAIAGGVGCLLNSAESYFGHERVGWSDPNDSDTLVDLVGHAWVMPRAALQSFWAETPITFENGEDIQLAAFTQREGYVMVVPAHREDDKESWSSLKGFEYGIDQVASSAVRNHSIFYEQRDSLVKQLTGQGWKLQRIK